MSVWRRLRRRSARRILRLDAGQCDERVLEIVAGRSACAVRPASRAPRPGPSAMTTIESQSADTSCITWLENSTHRPCSRSRRTMSRTARVLITSRPLVGSSSSTFDGSWTSARAIADLGALAVREAGRCGDRRSRSCRAGRTVRRRVASSARPLRPCSSPKYSDVLARGQPRIQAEAVGQHAEPGLRLLRSAHRIDVVDLDAAVVRPHHRVQHPQRRRLAGAVRAEQSRDRPLSAVKVTPFDGVHAPNRLWMQSTGSRRLPGGRCHGASGRVRPA